jgi:hypothetical protein
VRVTRETLIRDLPASTRLKNALLNDCWAPPGTLGGVLDRGNWEILRIPNFGKRCRAELKQILEDAGLR